MIWPWTFPLLSFLGETEAFWILGLLNNFLYVVMNAGAENINEASSRAAGGSTLVWLHRWGSTGPWWRSKTIPWFGMIWGCLENVIPNLEWLYINIPVFSMFGDYLEWLFWDIYSHSNYRSIFLLSPAPMAGWNRFGLLGQRSAATWMNGGFENTQGDDLWSIPLASWIQCCRKATLPSLATDGKYHHPQVGSSLNLLYRFTTFSIILGSKTLTKTAASWYGYGLSRYHIIIYHSIISPISPHIFHGCSTAIFSFKGCQPCHRLRTLLVKLTGPYWFHYVSYRWKGGVVWGAQRSTKMQGM